MTETSSSSRRKAPSLDPEDFASWEMLFQNYCGYQEWELFWKNEPEVDMDQIEQFQNAGDDTDESRCYEKQIRTDHKNEVKEELRKNLTEFSRIIMRESAYQINGDGIQRFTHCRIL